MNVFIDGVTYQKNVRSMTAKWFMPIKNVSKSQVTMSYLFSIPNGSCLVLP